jgi:hypothetical protein
MTQIHGYDNLIALQKWRLEKGRFIQQMDGFNCRLIACLKIMEMFHLACFNDVQIFYKTNNICHLVMTEWERLVAYCSKGIPVTQSERNQSRAA